MIKPLFVKWPGMVLMLLLLFGNLYAQTPGGTIQGTVKDEKAEVLVGATVRAERAGSASRTVTTNASGTYSLTGLAPGTYTLNFIYVGYKSKQIPNVQVQNGAQVTHSVELEVNGSDLNDVVVVGYGTQKKANLTGAVSQLDGKALENRPVANITQALQGAIPNVNVTFGSGGGRPGAEGSVNVRGYASINGANAGPLILIDGVPGTLNNINSHDVESITVLKDAGAAAIYGARAAFGVMLVTTKSGKSGAVKIDYRTNFGWGTPTVSTDFMTSGYDAALLNDEAFRRATGNSYTGYTQDDYAELLKRKTDPSLPSVVIQNRNGKNQYVYYGNTDWYHVIYRDWQPNMEHALSMNGGTDKLNFFLSGRMYQKDGMMKVLTDKYKMYNLRSKVSAEITSWLRVTNNTQFNFNSYTYPGFQTDENGNQNFVSPTVHALPSYVPTNPDGTATYQTQLNSYSIGDGVYADLQHGKSRGRRNETEFINNLQAVFSLAKGLHVTGNYSYSYTPTFLTNRRTIAPWSIYPGVVDQFGFDQLAETNYTTNYNVLNVFGDYQRSFGQNNFKITLGYNQEHSSYKRNYGLGTNLVSEDLNDLNLATGDMTVSGGANSWALKGGFARINYDYKGRYLVELNGRYDGTSRFPAGNRYGFFPSVSAGWRLSEESFFEGLKQQINEFKLRGSYGELGNQGEAAVYGYIPLLGRGTANYITDDQKTQYLSVPTPIAAGLTWERTRTLDIGVDLVAFKNRFNLTFDWYRRQTLDMLIPGKTLPAVFGAASPRQNAADLENRGWEIAAGWSDQFKVAGKPFSYDFNVSLADSKAKITRFDNPSFLLNDFFVGSGVGDIWGYRVDGYFASDAEAAAWKINQDYVNKQRLAAPGEWSRLKGGDLKFIDLNGDGKVDAGKNTLGDPGDQAVIGNTLPRYNFGVRLGANWNGFGISAFFQGIGKQNWYPGANADKFWGPYSRPYYSFVPENFAADVWTPENPNAYYPLLRGYDALNDRGSLNVKNDRYLQDLAYIRLKNLMVSYTLPVTFVKKLSLSQVMIYASGDNLWTATKLRSDYIDPEQASQETNGRIYPYSKTYSFGLNVSF
ncbi:SusC/RagA family TonB-linked outer membrane protein [Pedobacter yulinensis]|uniref:SusC/RagA family TonB-linked outer membrane protein n=1 Tax=Pedobacter yulinensis TaxID=2126353 RepID=A0A2T3HNF0_9SPHI|nr:TonB-dependent receptor [Pedobacter yulinensis]PST83959.1 SusC/RagA family TonB-linked outer membrane protein [Pedobacter yulinensis]